MTFVRTDDRLSQPVTVEADGHYDRGESGAILVLSAFALVVLIGVAGFAVDLGWLYWQRAEATKAAESAALAGVVYMPHVDSSWGAGVPAFDEARDIADRAGYSHGVNSTVTPAKVAGHVNRLAVGVERVTPTIFMRLFGISTVSIVTTATAEFLPPLKVGSDESYIGNDPDSNQRDVGYWLAVNGAGSMKVLGDPFSVDCVTPPVCPNLEKRTPAYFYAVDVPPSEVGKSLDVQIFDGQLSAASVTGELFTAAPAINLEFELYAPDQTPANPSDNTSLVCHRTFTNSTGANDHSAWDSLMGCPITAVEGIYVLAVDVPGTPAFGTAAFSLRAVVGGSTRNDVAMYGIGAMSLWIGDHQQRPSRFRVAKVEERYAGNDLIVSLFDLGDVNTARANIEITGALMGVECDVRVRNIFGQVTQDWAPDDGGRNHCMIDVSGQKYNGQWVDLRLGIPRNYNCDNQCWVDIRYTIRGGDLTPIERTTWTAGIEGRPLRIVP